jgi:hypothetical protein
MRERTIVENFIAKELKPGMTVFDELTGGKLVRIISIENDHLIVDSSWQNGKRNYWEFSRNHKGNK